MITPYVDPVDPEGAREQKAYPHLQTVPEKPSSPPTACGAACEGEESTDSWLAQAFMRLQLRFWLRPRLPEAGLQDAPPQTAQSTAADWTTRSMPPRLLPGFSSCIVSTQISCRLLLVDSSLHVVRFSGQALAEDPFKDKTEVRFHAFGNVLMILGVGERLLQVQDAQMEGLSPAVSLLSPAPSTWLV
ncbi:unnamed protein product, partial [Rangifer tarandus platyrhynchus]